MMKKGMAALVLALVLMLAVGCSGGGSQTVLILDEGWQEHIEESGQVRYVNSFTADLLGEGRVLLHLSHLEQTASVWLNGTAFEEAGAKAIDVTEVIKRTGRNELLILASANAEVEQTALSVHPQLLISQIQRQGQSVVVTLDNAQKSTDVTLQAVWMSRQDGTVISRTVNTVTAPGGISEHILDFESLDIQPWSMDDPALYEISVTVSTEKFSDTAIHTTGLSSMDKPTGPIYTLPADATMRQSVERAYAQGYGGVYCVDGPTQALLNYCDRIGMPVIVEESAVVGDHPCVIALSQEQLSQIVGRD